MRLIGLIPAAGYATRLGSPTASKETHPIRGRPVMDYLIDRMRRAGCRDIRVVTRPEKIDVIEHSAEQGLTIVCAHPQSVSESLLAGLKGAAAFDVALFGFPDTIWEPLDGFSKLVAALDEQERYDVALGIFLGSEPERSDVVVVEDGGTITSIAVKPKQPATGYIWGCGAVRSGVLDQLARDPEPGVVFDSMARNGRVTGVFLSDRFVDIGTPEALTAYMSAADDGPSHDR